MSRKHCSSSVGNAYVEDDYLNVFRNMIVSVSHRAHSMSWRIEIGYVLKYQRGGMALANVLIQLNQSPEFWQILILI